MRSVDEWLMSRSCHRVLHCRHGIAAQHAREAGNALALLGVALVRHRTGARLALVERLLGFANFGLLQRANLGGELFQRGADERERGHELRVPVALDDLRGSVFDAQPEVRADDLLQRRGNGGVRAHGAADGADGDSVARARQPFAVAAHFVHPHRQLQAERRRLGVHAVGAAHAEGVAMGGGLPLKHHDERVDVGEQQVRGVPELEARGRIPDVRAREPEVNPPPFVPKVVRYRAEERRHVVVGDREVLIDLRKVEGRVRTDLRGVGGGNLAQFGPGLARGNLDVEPALELGLVGPKGGHLGAGVTRYHSRILARRHAKEHSWQADASDRGTPPAPG